MTAYPCPCCGFLTLSEPPPGTYQICAVCWWEDDLVQAQDPHFAGGANVVSLAQAKENYRAFGASDPGDVDIVRKPLPHEYPVDSPAREN